ncbi:hypothetical protein GFER_06950 [Geoalkalibacter ferrihydriticus DSM 17813]|uniref:Uncharacterized protein n=2 Tax=Geoalkalibacter ferrihydriticus TaxID=392333 RepID=A0A0C2HPH5_9BACT|nr:hypothetical protein [Geoalkalibacter ferrihydriticus]KIH76840.1 hypothetical protein GFER_06950 [Geoalkalibacter ferrihydriticus DSM 17813]
MKSLAALLLAFTMLLAACGGSSNEEAATTRNAHEPGWKFTHDIPTLAAQSRGDLSECQVCHRADLRGGGGVPSCFVCHLDGPPFDLHPLSAFSLPGLPWAHPLNHGRAAKADIASCQGCHGESGGAGSNPRFNISMRDLPGGCESLQCHDNGRVNEETRVNTFVDTISGQLRTEEVAHPVNAAHPGSSAPDEFWWFGQRLEFELPEGLEIPDGFEFPEGFGVFKLGHWDVQNMDGCKLCHGIDGLGGSGPSCLDCHVSSPFDHPDRCVSCHGPLPIVPRGNTVLQYLEQLNRAPGSFRGDFFELVDEGYHLGFNHTRESEYAACGNCHFDDPDFVPPDPFEDPEGFQEFVNDPTRIVNYHHLLVGQPIPQGTVAPYPPFNQPGQPYFCFSCHVITSVDGGFEATPPPKDAQGRTDCAFCHRR